MLMRCVFVLVGLSVGMSLRAEEPHFEFTRGLRDDGKADLALRYLEDKGSTFTASLAAILPLELAQTRLELATLRPDAASRTPLLDQAQIEAQGFVKANPNHRLRPEAELIAARVAALRANAQFDRARKRVSNGGWRLGQGACHRGLEGMVGREPCDIRWRSRGDAADSAESSRPCSGF